MTTKLKINIGLSAIRKPVYASEPSFVSDVNKQMRAVEACFMDIFDQFEDVSAEIMHQALQPVFEESQRIVPVREGTLKDSGYLQIAGKGKNARVEIGYAPGGNPRHGVYVHEMMDVKHAEPTQAKFLEMPMMQRLDQIFASIGSQYHQFMSV